MQNPLQMLEILKRIKPVSVHQALWYSCRMVLGQCTSIYRLLRKGQVAFPLPHAHTQHVFIARARYLDA